MEPFISEIRLFPYTDVPAGWLPCDGRILQIRDHQALFSLIESTYGGDGRTNFALPDLRGRVPAGAHDSLRAGQAFAFRAGSKGQATLALHFCIAVKGLFPTD